MKNWFSYSATFVLLVFLVDYIIGVQLSKRYENNFCVHAGGDLNHYLKRPPIDTVFLGSSRVNTMIIPTIIGEKVINVSKPSKHLYYNAAVVDLMEQKGKLPRKMLVLNLEVEDAYASMQTKLHEDVHYLKYYYHQNSFIRELINRKHWLEPFKYIFSSYKFNGENFTIVTNPLQNICTSSPDGFYPLPEVQHDSLNFIASMEERGKGFSGGFHPEFEKMLLRINLICKRNQVQLVLLYGPNYSNPTALSKAANYTAQLCRLHNITFLDFNKLHPDVFKKIHWWFDSYHLNLTGAKKYSLLLKKELIRLKKPTAENSRIIN